MRAFTGSEGTDFMQTLNMPTRDYGLMKQMKTIVALNDDVKLEFPAFDNILVAARQMGAETALG